MDVDLEANIMVYAETPRPVALDWLLAGSNPLVQGGVTTVTFSMGEATSQHFVVRNKSAKGLFDASRGGYCCDTWIKVQYNCLVELVVGRRAAMLNEERLNGREGAMMGLLGRIHR